MNKNKLISLIHQVSKKSNIPFNAVLTHYFLELILKCISRSPFSNNFIFKGGFLLANIFGLHSRTTVDMDLLLANTPLTAASIENIFTEIFKEKVQGVTFQIIKLEEIRVNDEYNSYRLFILGRFENIKVQIPIDIATGDVITPGPIEYEFNSNFNDEQIYVSSYNINTILAEKLHTLYQRGVFNSRSKDFYDIYIIYKLNDRLDYKTLKLACERTFKYRKTPFSIKEILRVIQDLKRDENIKARWYMYTQKANYAKGIHFENLMNSITQLVSQLEDNKL